MDKILDTAGQKGTGKWTSVSSLDLGMPVTLIGEAVYARCLSAMKEDRVEASKLLKGPKFQFSGDRAGFEEDIRQALLASKIVSYAQGFMLLREAAQEYHWNLNYGGIALVWRAGCIIRSAFLGKIKEAFDHNPESEQSVAGSVFHRRDRALPEFLAAGGGARRGKRSARAGLHHRAGVLRRLPQRAAPRQSSAGAARLLRRPHLRAGGPPARPVLPHQLDRQGRPCLGGDVHGVGFYDAEARRRGGTRGEELENVFSAFFSAPQRLRVRVFRVGP